LFCAGERWRSAASHKGGRPGSSPGSATRTVWPAPSGERHGGPARRPVRSSAVTSLGMKNDRRNASCSRTAHQNQ